MVRLALGTENGVVGFEGEGVRWKEVFRVLEGEDLVCVRFFPDNSRLLLAGSYGNGLFKVDLESGSAERTTLAEPYVRTIAFFREDPSTVYAGSEPAELYRSQDRGSTWAELGVRRLPEAKHWSLPYSPRAGALRAIALPPVEPDRIYAGVEQGGFLRSDDLGASWRLVAGPVDKDIHALGLHPEKSEVVFAATGEGVYRSGDGGVSWERLREEYCRGIAVDPGDADRIIAGPAADVGEGGRVLISEDRGTSWGDCMTGLEGHSLADMAQWFVWEAEYPGAVFMIRSNGELWTADAGDWKWHRLFREVVGIQSVSLCVP